MPIMLVQQNTTGNAATANKATFATTAGNGVPIGTIIAYAGTTLPADWLWCDGSSFSTTAYPELYNAIKYSWGGSGSSFNLPDLRGLFMRGNQNMKNSNDRPPATHDPDGNGRTLGSYQDDAFQGHGHRFSTPMNQANQQTSGSSGTARIYAEGLNDTWDVLTIVSGSHGTPRYTTETRPKNVYVNYIIKAK